MAHADVMKSLLIWNNLMQIAGKINKVIRELGLRELGQLEQDLVFGNAGTKEVINFLRTKQVCLMRLWFIFDTCHFCSVLNFYFVEYSFTFIISMLFLCRISLVKINCVCWWSLQPSILTNLKETRVQNWCRWISNYIFFSFPFCRVFKTLQFLLSFKLLIWHACMPNFPFVEEL